MASAPITVASELVGTLTLGFRIKEENLGILKRATNSEILLLFGRTLVLSTMRDGKQNSIVESFLSSYATHRDSPGDSVSTIISLRVEEKRKDVELQRLREQVRGEYNLASMVTRNEKMKHVFELSQQVAETEATVLILGETGTGKELLARAIHFKSARRNQPFVVINCSALSETLLESELFGHEKGAFTGASRERIGKFKEASEGTAFLDEIGDVSPHVQTKLLRVLQEKEIERVGGNCPLPVDVRIIAATNRNLQELLAKGTFREDLYYRLNVFPVQLPPLRERLDDLPLLIDHFLKKYAEMSKNRIAFCACLHHGVRLERKCA